MWTEMKADKFKKGLMLAEVIATSFQQRWQTKSKNGKTLEDIVNLIYIHNTNPQKH